MSVTLRAVQSMLTDLSIPSATASDVKVHSPAGRVGGIRVVSPQLAYDRIWYPARRMWVSDSPEYPGSSVEPSGLPASASAYTLGAAIIADLWDVAARRQLTERESARAYFEACSRSCEVFLTASLQQSLAGPFAGETLAYARSVVAGRTTPLSLPNTAAQTPPPVSPPAEPIPAPERAVPEVMYVPVVVPHRTGLRPATIVALTLVGVAVVGSAIAAVVAITAPRTGALDAGTAVAEEGVLLEADVAVNDGEAWQCHDEYDCWAWYVTPAENCDAVDVTFGFASTPEGDSERSETRRMHGFYANEPQDVTLNLEPQQYEYARIDEIRCMD